MRLIKTALGLVFLCWASVLVGCTPILPISRSPVTPPASTFTPIPTFTPTVSVTPPPTMAAISTQPGPAATFYGAVSVDGANLRTGPGTVFPVRRLLAKGTQVLVLGVAPGGEWLFIQTDENARGWLLHWLVEGGGNPPAIQPENAQVIQGRVVDRSGQPVSGIGFAVTQGSGPSAPRTDASSDVAGRFYAFLPRTASGQWLVTYVSVACTSNTMDAKCNCIGACGRPDPESATIMLPFDGMLEFAWK